MKLKIKHIGILLIYLLTINGCTSLEKEKIREIENKINEIEKVRLSDFDNYSENNEKIESLQLERSYYNEIIERKQFSLWLTFGIFGGILFLFIILFIYSIPIYNRINDLDLTINEQAAQLQSTYQRRYELIENYVTVVKGYTKHERKTLTRVMQARSKATSNNFHISNFSSLEFHNFLKAQEEMSLGLGRLIATVENYPELKANPLFQELHSQINNTENIIDNHRHAFNSSVKQYNQKIKNWPDLIIARITGYKPRNFIDYNSMFETVPEVKF